MINKPELTSIEKEKATNVEFNTSIFEKSPRKSFIKKLSNSVKNIFSLRKRHNLAPEFNFMPEQKQSVECSAHYEFAPNIAKASDMIMHAGMFTVFYAFMLHHLGFASYQDQLMLLGKPESTGVSLMIFGIVHASCIIFKLFIERNDYKKKYIKSFGSIWAPFNMMLVTAFFLPLSGGSSLFIDFTKIMITLTSKLL